MSMENFQKYILPMIQDGYLDTGEERECMMEAAKMGIDAARAQRELELCCAKHGAILERLAKKEFKESVRADVGDKFLDMGEYESLLSSGLEKHC